ncbi:DUF533 domain-containing protein [Geitlerinema sp. CS-897]|nr:DUF533 domain-containing protein [Geitlerinema sp. CS-897]
MSDRDREALASLNVLVLTAQADGVLTDEERNALEAAWAQLESPPEDLTLDRLLSQPEDLDSSIAQITRPEIQTTLYDAAFTMAKLGGTTPQEQEILDRLRVAFEIDSQQDEELFETALEALSDESGDEILEATGDPTIREQNVRSLVLDYSIGIAILGFNPIPGLNAITALAAYVLELKMMRAIGAKWGYPKGQDALAVVGNIFGGLGAFAAALTTWAAVSVVGIFVPVLGSAASASFWFTLTWALGQATNRYYASGRQMSSEELKQVFRNAKQEGKSVYEANSEAIAAKRDSVRPRLDALSRQLKEGKITQQEYRERLRELVGRQSNGKVGDRAGK